MVTKGTDRWDRQKTIIGNRVGDGLLFPSICVVMQNRHETLTDLLRRQVQDSLQDLTKKIKGDVDSALASIRQLHQAGLVEEMAAVKALVGELKATALWLGEEVHGE